MDGLIALSSSQFVFEFALLSLDIINIENEVLLFSTVSSVILRPIRGYHHFISMLLVQVFQFDFSKTKHKHLIYQPIKKYVCRLEISLNNLWISSAQSLISSVTDLNNVNVVLGIVGSSNDINVNCEFRSLITY